MRAVWITSIYSLDWPQTPHTSAAGIEQQKMDLEAFLDQLKKANFNTVFIQTRLRGDVIYQSKIEPYTTHVGIRHTSHRYDALAFAVDECHKRGLECHAWFVTYPLGKESTVVPKKNRDFVKKHRDEMYLDPGNPKTARYLLSLIHEIVEKYDIDGIHLDYIRYPDMNFPDKATFNLYGKGQNKDFWRRDNINRFVYQLYDQVKEWKPWVQVSSSVIGMYDDHIKTGNRYLTALSVSQDPENWLANGKHDFVVPMMYHKDNLFFPFVEDWQSRSHGRLIIPGLGVYRMDKKEGNWTLDDLTAQVDATRTLQMGGQAFYRMKYLTDNTKGIMDKLASDYYRYPALPLPMPWLNNIPPLPPYEVEAVCNGNFLQLSWQPTRQPDRKHVVYNIYRSQNYPVDTQKVTNMVATRVAETSILISVNHAIESGYYYVVTSYDRFHNESLASAPVYFVTGAER
jgi:uncharacterized lipoprotein YddW (UPF0748 family)